MLSSMDFPLGQAGANLAGGLSGGGAWGAGRRVLAWISMSMLTHAILYTGDERSE